MYSFEIIVDVWRESGENENCAIHTKGLVGRKLKGDEGRFAEAVFRRATNVVVGVSR